MKAEEKSPGTPHSPLPWAPDHVHGGPVSEGGGRPPLTRAGSTSAAAAAAIGPGQALSAQPIPTPALGQVPARRPSQWGPQSERGRRKRTPPLQEITAGTKRGS